MNIRPLRDLAAEWRKDAARFRAYGDERGAQTCELHADEMEATLRSWWTEPLGIDEGAAELRVSYDALYKRLVRGAVPNVGTPGAPRVRRCDLYGAPEVLGRVG